MKKTAIIALFAIACADGEHIECAKRVSIEGDAPQKTKNLINQACLDFHNKTKTPKSEVTGALEGATIRFVHDDERKMCEPIDSWSCSHDLSKTSEVYHPLEPLLPAILKHEVIHLILFELKLEDTCSHHEWMAENGLCYLNCNPFLTCLATSDH